MLKFRRILAFASRVHSYLFLMQLFFAAIFIMTFFFESGDGLVELALLSMNVISWASVIFGLWICVASLCLTAYSKVFAFSPFFFTVLRVVLILAISFIADFLETMVTKGLSI